MVGEALGALKRCEDQMPSWIQSEEEGPSVPATMPIILNMASLQSFPQHNKHSWMDLHNRYVELASTSKANLAFIGDSIINGLSRYKHIWKKFSSYNVINLGIGGDKIQNVFWRIKNGTLPMKATTFLVLHCGTNNIDNDKPIDIAEGILSIANYVHERNPNIFIIIVGLMPRDQLLTSRRQKLNAVNDLLDFFAKRLTKKNCTSSKQHLIGHAQMKPLTKVYITKISFIYQKKETKRLLDLLLKF